MTTSSTITSEELNFIIFRYLQESGFTHAAFALGYEAGINRTRIDGNSIPPGALVTVVQKGLQYIELEANLDSGNICGDDGFSHLQPLDIITKDVDELPQIIKEKKDKLLKERDLEKDCGRERDREREERDRERQERDRERDGEKENVEKDKDQEREHEKDKQPEGTHC